MGKRNKFSKRTDDDLKQTIPFTVVILVFGDINFFFSCQKKYTKSVKQLTLEMKLIKIILISLFVNLSIAQEVIEKAAGLIVFRHIDSRIEYLMLKPSNPHGKWSPPKGKLICERLFSSCFS